jgi:hypothetical protein
MAPKSRRNRRIISTNTVPAAVGNIAAIQNKPVAPVIAKPATVESFVTAANFTRDLKWTGIVTLIIAVLIVIAMVVIPH